MSITSVRLAPDLETRLTAAAEAVRRSKSWLINEAVRCYLERLDETDRRWKDTLEALESVKTGQLIDGDSVDAWLASWGDKPAAKRPRRR